MGDVHADKFRKGETKLAEFLRRKLVAKKGKGYSLTHHGFHYWMLSRGAPKDWDSLNLTEQKRWTNKIIEHIIAQHREKLPKTPIGLSDPTLHRKQRRYIASVEQDMKDLSDMAHTRMEGLSHWSIGVKLTPTQRKEWEKKHRRIANLYTILVNIHSKLGEGEITFE